MLTTIINYCTNDFRFLKICVDAVRLFSDQIIIPVCDHFFCGEKENRALLHHSYNLCSDCKFVEFAFDENRPYGLFSSTSTKISKNDDDWKHYWHSTARYIGFQMMERSDSGYVLFIDVDEIADTKRMQEWLEKFPFDKYNGIRFTSYFYFRESIFRAEKLFKNGLMVRKDKVAPELLLDIHERRGVFVSLPGPKIDNVGGLDGNPLFHHYSWVKPKHELLRKVKSWGHSHERDWESCINNEYSKNDFDSKSGKDSIWGFSYKQVSPLCDPLTVPVPQESVEKLFDNVTCIDRQSLQRLQIDSIFSD